jgi:imidazole glycerol-phosphate synthase subunit HisH
VNVGIIDYGGGNLRSVANALRSLGTEPRVVSSPEDAENLSHLILPGQGAFGDVMTRLGQRGLTDPLRRWIAADKPYFGICVGYQILFDSSEEAPGQPGLGIIPGNVRRFAGEPGLKIPHMGWNSALATRGDTPVWNGLGQQPFFYYVHSYFPVPAQPDVTVAQTTYGTQTFAGAVERGRLFACQFHPEKSQSAGLRLIRNFIGP